MHFSTTGGGCAPWLPHSVHTTAKNEYSCITADASITEIIFCIFIFISWIYLGYFIYFLVFYLLSFGGFERFFLNQRAFTSSSFCFIFVLILFMVLYFTLCSCCTTFLCCMILLCYFWSFNLALSTSLYFQFYKERHFIEKWFTNKLITIIILQSTCIISEIKTTEPHLMSRSVVDTTVKQPNSCKHWPVISLGRVEAHDSMSSSNCAHVLSP